MRVAIVQTSPIVGEKELNLRDLDNLIGGGDGSDIYVIPEMFNTALVIEADTIAETMDGETLKWMKQKAALLDAAIVGSLAISENGKTYNRLCFVKPDGSVEYYDKRHLFTYGGEGAYITPGRERRVVEFRGLRVMLQVCYDVRFPVFVRNRDDYDMIIYVASWPVARKIAWNTLIRARAIENQCFVAAVNRVGVDQFGVYSGDSVIITPYGEDLVAAEPGKVDMVSAELDLEKLYHFREKFPVLDDADTDLYMV
ncbi:MAG: nitrilase family protein [Bacteroidaceae bacterium]|nr:nitrilase family protein [Bacteroidaceae bacterium]